MSGPKNETGRRLWLTADKSSVVDEGSPLAAFLLVGVGGTVPAEHADVYRSHIEAPATDAHPEPKKSDSGPAPKPRPRKRSSKRASVADVVVAAAAADAFAADD